MQEMHIKLLFYIINIPLNRFGFELKQILSFV